MKGLSAGRDSSNTCVFGFPGAVERTTIGFPSSRAHAREGESIFMNTEVVMEALGIMGKGMLGIFVVIVVIALLVYLLTKVTSRKQS